MTLRNSKTQEPLYFIYADIWLEDFYFYLSSMLSEEALRSHNSLHFLCVHEEIKANITLQNYPIDFLALWNTVFSHYLVCQKSIAKVSSLELVIDNSGTTLLVIIRLHAQLPPLWIRPFVTCRMLLLVMKDHSTIADSSQEGFDNELINWISWVLCLQGQRTYSWFKAITKESVHFECLLNLYK